MKGDIIHCAHFDMLKTKDEYTACGKHIEESEIIKNERYKKWIASKEYKENRKRMKEVAKTLVDIYTKRYQKRGV